MARRLIPHPIKFTLADANWHPFTDLGINARIVALQIRNTIGILNIRATDDTPQEDQYEIDEVFALAQQTPDFVYDLALLEFKGAASDIIKGEYIEGAF